MYDVIYIDSTGRDPVAQHLADRKDAAAVAKQARRARRGPDDAPGSSKLPNCVCVIPVAARSRLAADR